MYTDGRPPRTTASYTFGKSAVGIAPRGENYLLVDAKHQVSMVRSDGSIMWSVGSKGSGKGALNCPYGVVDLGSLIAVSDQNNHRVCLLDSSGKFVRVLTNQTLNHPRGLALDRVGNIVVADHANDRVLVLTPEDSCVRVLGSAGAERGQLHRPFDVAVDAVGNILVADWGNSRVVVFGPDGEASHFSTPGKPQGICVDHNGNVIVSLAEGQIILY